MGGGHYHCVKKSASLCSASVCFFCFLMLRKIRSPTQKKYWQEELNWTPYYYYFPIFVSGDPRGLCETSVLAVDPNDNFPLVPSNGDRLPSTTQVKHIKVYQNNILMDHCSLFSEMGQIIFKKRGSATAADGVSMQASTVDVTLKKHIIKGMEKTKADGFAPGDMLINKFNGGDTGSAAAIVDAIQSRKRQLSKDTTMTENYTLDTSEHVFPHKSETEALLILRRYGTVCDVPRDGSCGNHAIMLLLCRMKLIDNTPSVTQFWHELNYFIECNMNKFVGVSHDGNEAIFQYPWGHMNHLKKV